LSARKVLVLVHSPVDLGFPDRHDDPQSFNLQTWATKLETLIAQIRSIP